MIAALAFVLWGNLAAPCEGLPADYLSRMEQVVAAVTRYEEVLADAEQSARRWPECADAHLGLAVVLNGRLQSASGLTALRLSRRYRGVLDRVLAIAPAHPRARHELAQFLIHAPGIAGGNRNEARRVIAQIAATHPADGARLQLELARAEGTSLSILAALEGVARLVPDDIDVGFDLTQRLARLRRFDEARAALQRLTTVATARRATLGAAYLGGRLHQLAGDNLDDAIALFQRYLTDGGPAGERGLPSASMVWFRIGEAHEAAGRCAPASDAYEQAAGSGAAVDGLEAARRRVRSCRSPGIRHP